MLRKSGCLQALLALQDYQPGDKVPQVVENTELAGLQIRLPMREVRPAKAAKGPLPLQVFPRNPSHTGSFQFLEDAQVTYL